MNRNDILFWLGVMDVAAGTYRNDVWTIILGLTPCIWAFWNAPAT